MNNQQLSSRIVFDPETMSGKPVIRSIRLTVEFILNLLAHGATILEIVGKYEGEPSR